MLGKLLKYEIPALGRSLMPLYIGWTATAVLLGLAVGPLSSTSDFMVIVTGMMYSAVATAVVVMAVVMIIQRYKNSLLGDQAYFYQVLPVSAAEHIASKSISALVWILLSGVAMLLTGLVIALFSGELLKISLPELFRALAELKLSGWLTVLLSIIALAFSITKSILGIYAAITIGHQVQKHTVLASIGAYIGVLTFETCAGRILFAPISRLWYRLDDLASFNLIMVVAILVSAALGAVYFFICRYLMENKLNIS